MIAPRVALVGLGRVSYEHYFGWRLAGCEVVAVCDPDPIKIAASPVGDVPGYESITPMLEAESIDIVDLCTPHHLHVAQLSHLRDRAVAILLEKPIADTPQGLAVANEIIVSHRAGFALRTNKRFEEHVRELERHISSSENTLQSISVLWKQKPQYLEQRPWYYSTSISSGGVVLGMGVHYFDILVDLFPDCNLRTARLDRISHRSGFVPDVENCAILDLNSSKCPEIHLQLSCYEESESLPVEEIVVTGNNGSKLFVRSVTNHDSILRNEFSFYRKVLEQKRCYPQPEHLVSAHRISFDCYHMT